MRSSHSLIAAGYAALVALGCNSSKAKAPSTPAVTANIVEIGDAAVIVGDAGPKIASGALLPADAAAPIVVVDVDAGDTANAPFSLRFERTACLGTCPQYVVKVDNVGQVTFASRLSRGGRGSWVDGCAAKDIGQKGVIALQDAVHQAAFFDLKSKYDGGPTDSPWAYTTVDAENRTHTVKHYSAAPMKAAERKRLETLEGAIDHITGADEFATQAGKLKPCTYDPSK